jgi:hypothetical protein
MQPNHKVLVIAALKNGVFWSAILMLLSYFKNGILNWNYLPLWFLFFAATGAARTHYFKKKNK